MRSSGCTIFFVESEIRSVFLVVRDWKYELEIGWSPVERMSQSLISITKMDREISKYYSPSSNMTIAVQYMDLWSIKYVIL